MEQRFTLDEDAKVLRDFLTDIKCIEPIRDRADKFNIFDIFGFARNEIRHSFFLRWILDPNENHGLGDLFIRSLLSYLVSTEPDRYGSNSFDLLMMDCTSFSVQREMKNIDLFLLSESQSVAITIENKIGSHEHSSTDFDSQLDKYRAYVEETYRHIKTRIYVYLTPFQESPSDEENWQTLSYSTIVDIIDEIYKDNLDRLSPEIKSLIRCYSDIIRRDIVEDQDLNALCNEIYHKHRKALDLIYIHSDLGTNPAKRMIPEVLSELSQSGSIAYDPKDRFCFHSPVMTSFLPKLKEPDSSWSSLYIYNYWFNIDSEHERICFIFELGFAGIDDETRNKMIGFINTRHPRSKKLTSRFKRVETFSWIKLHGLSEDDIKCKIRDTIKDVLKQESVWISECEEYLQEHNPHANLHQFP